MCSTAPVSLDKPLWWALTSRTRVRGARSGLSLEGKDMKGNVVIPLRNNLRYRPACLLL